MSILAQPTTTCPLCDEPHDEVLALLAEEPERELRRIASGDLLAEREYLERELAEARANARYSGDLKALHRHWLKAVNRELARRRGLERYRGPKVPGRGSVPQATIDEIKEAVDLVNLVAEDLGDPSYFRRERAYFHCRHHGSGRDTNPSLVVFEDQRRWWCFGCNQGGDCFDWLLLARNMSWREAVEHLAARHGIAL